MSGVIVTVKRSGDTQYKVVEVPMDLPSADLAALLSEALGWHTDRAGKQISFQIEAELLQRRLYPHESLQKVGVLKGSALILHQVVADHELDVFRPGFSPERVGLLRPGYHYMASLPAHDNKPIKHITPAILLTEDQPQTNPIASPLTGWQSLGLNLSSSSSRESGEPVDKTKESPFKWKQLDD